MYLCCEAGDVITSLFFSSEKSVLLPIPILLRNDCILRGRIPPRDNPKQFMPITSAEDIVLVHRVSCGALHSATLTADGRIFTWGSGEVNDVDFRRQNELRDLNANGVSGDLPGSDGSPVSESHSNSLIVEITHGIQGVGKQVRMSAQPIK